LVAGIATGGRRKSPAVIAGDPVAGIRRRWPDSGDRRKPPPLAAGRRKLPLAIANRRPDSGDRRKPPAAVIAGNRPPAVTGGRTAGVLELIHPIDENNAPVRGMDLNLTEEADLYTTGIPANFYQESLLRSVAGNVRPVLKVDSSSLNMANTSAAKRLGHAASTCNMKVTGALPVDPPAAVLNGPPPISSSSTRADKGQLPPKSIPQWRPVRRHVASVDDPVAAIVDGGAAAMEALSASVCQPGAAQGWSGNRIGPAAVLSELAARSWWTFRLAVLVGGMGVDANLTVLQVIGSPEGCSLSSLSSPLAPASRPRVSKASSRAGLGFLQGLWPENLVSTSLVAKVLSQEVNGQDPCR
ncbi:hypothetical protein Taro_035464, partial [Colocasia esculenta]|nr:hypothetical protein [Colocasia esculenta]